jgi:hypothetical protein
MMTWLVWEEPHGLTPVDLVPGRRRERSFLQNQGI